MSGGVLLELKNDLIFIKLEPYRWIDPSKIILDIRSWLSENIPKLDSSPRRWIVRQMVGMDAKTIGVVEFDQINDAILFKLGYNYGDGKANS